MSTLRTTILRLAASTLTSPRRRGLQRRVHALRRRLRGGRPVVHYFHQPDDPYSQLAAQMLAPLLERYAVELKTWLVPPPEDSAVPEREKLRAYGLRDAPRLARAYGLAFPEQATPPDPVTDLQAGAQERRRLGHYLGAMFYFEGEWYWGVDRLGHLEARFTAMGLDRGAPPLAPAREPVMGPVAGAGRPLTIELWFSFRSPYSWLVMPRIRALARHYGAELKLRFILPMVMRGLPVPRIKTFYIALDCKREAERLGLPFGRIVDPVGGGAERALAVLNHAIGLGRGEEFAELALRAAFADGIALAEDEGLHDVARRAGLTDAQAAAALADESWREVAEANRTALFDAGLWGPPSFRVNGRAPHWGQDRLWMLEEDILEELAGSKKKAAG